MSLTRRTLLGGLGGLLLTAPAGCTIFDDEAPQPRASASQPPPPDPLLPLLNAETALLAQYDAVVARHPQLGSRIARLRTDHAAHLEALRGIVRNPAATSATPTRPTASPDRALAPATPAGALAALRVAESAAARRLAAACLAAPPAQAALLGSIAACESAHLVLLR